MLPVWRIPVFSHYNSTAVIYIYIHAQSVPKTFNCSPRSAARRRERDREIEVINRRKLTMEFSRILIFAYLIAVVLLPCVFAQALAPAPAPTSDGISVDQGVAYVLMLLALVLTYLIHPLDASYNFV